MFDQVVNVCILASAASKDKPLVFALLVFVVLFLCHQRRAR